MPSNILCPICRSNSDLFASMNSKFIINSFENDYKESVPDDLEIIDYEMRKCQKCTLVFASPMKHGSDNFYKWITKHPGYYAINRWEWNIVLGYIKRNKIKSLLEVGCGTGNFLKRCKEIGGMRVVGLDTDKDSIDECKKNGIEAYCDTIENYSKLQKEKFETVVSFHCLEHVDNPLTFMKSQLLILKNNGKILASTPYTTTPGEQWYETLNHPPHHMTQWNHKSYSELAKQLKLNLKLYMPNSLKTARRIVNSLHLMFNGVSNYKKYSHRKRKITVLFHSLLKPIITAREIHRHIKREKINTFNLENGKEIQGCKTADYVVLAEMSKKE